MPNLDIEITIRIPVVWSIALRISGALPDGHIVKRAILGAWSKWGWYDVQWNDGTWQKVKA